MRAGDLIGTGTISGPHDSMYGCLLEMTWRGTKDVVIRSNISRIHENNQSAESQCNNNNDHVNNGVVDNYYDTAGNAPVVKVSPCPSYATVTATPPLSVTRRYLEDGDVVRMTGFAQGSGYRIGFGEVVGRVMPAIKDPY